MGYTTPEKKVQTPIIEYLDSLIKQGYPILYEHRVAQGPNYRKGRADLWFSIKGQHIEVEFKSPDGHTTPLQDKWRDTCFSVGTPCWLINNVDEFKVMLNNVLSKKS